MINLYFRLLQNERNLLSNEEMVSRVVAQLITGEHFTQAGQLYEAMNRSDKALECYRKGNAFAKAVELARYYSPKGILLEFLYVIT